MELAKTLGLVFGIPLTFWAGFWCGAIWVAQFG